MSQPGAWLVLDGAKRKKKSRDNLLALLRARTSNVEPLARATMQLGVRLQIPWSYLPLRLPRYGRWPTAQRQKPRLTDEMERGGDNSTWQEEDAAGGEEKLLQQRKRSERGYTYLLSRHQCRALQTSSPRCSSRWLHSQLQEPSPQALLDPHGYESFSPEFHRQKLHNYCDVNHNFR
ncbi:hypothetical protein C0Q70_20440 [Pomacea canaliculata]|uniref:Uncharacterized protein n=1 Tax=Pomacea canaliculata TaxID=400727 RepID=A0A2T7NFL2_POMCA|nr:hypothetical protein C0Q70_20440 [Pomacea canaliculata]